MEFLREVYRETSKSLLFLIVTTVAILLYVPTKGIACRDVEPSEHYKCWEVKPQYRWFSEVPRNIEVHLEKMLVQFLVLVVWSMMIDEAFLRKELKKTEFKDDKIELLEYQLSIAQTKLKDAGLDQ